ncbi:MAG: DUF2341 domain-containing protein, partial [Verrucomicrobiota bacterium]
AKPGSWDNSFAVGSFTNASGLSLTHPITSLQSGMTYFVTWRATNAFIDIWTETKSFVAPWYTNSVKFTFCGYAGSETLTNVPALIVLSSDILGFNYNQFSSTKGDDLRFYSVPDGRELNYEIESWDTNDKSTVWVQVPALIDNTTCIKATWGSPYTFRPIYTTNGATWSEGYEAVWHFHGNLNDSTRRHDGLAFGGPLLTNVPLVSGALQFDGVDDFVRGAGTFNAFPNGVTFEGWAYTESVANGAGFIDLGVRLPNGAAGNSIFLARNANTDQLRWRVSHTAGDATLDSSGARIRLNEWQHFVATAEGNTAPGAARAELYENGALEDSRTNFNPPANLSRTNGFMAESNLDTDDFFHGKLAEVRISTVRR